MLYRILIDIRRGETTLLRGSLTRLEWLSPAIQERLVTRGAVTPVGTPPLTVLPGWQLRGAKLARIGIADAVQFLEADVDRVAGFMRVKPVTVVGWQQEVTGWLSAGPSPPSG